MAILLRYVWKSIITVVSAISIQTSIQTNNVFSTNTYFDFLITKRKMEQIE